VVGWLKCEYMRDKVGEEFTGIITAATNFGLFVELDEVYVEGLVHISALSSDYYHFDDVRHRLTGEKSGIIYGLGDPVSVRVVKVDLDDRKIDFELTEGGRKNRWSKDGGESTEAKGKKSGKGRAGRSKSSKGKVATSKKKPIKKAPAKSSAGSADESVKPKKKKPVKKGAANADAANKGVVKKKKSGKKAVKKKAAKRIAKSKAASVKKGE